MGVSLAFITELTFSWEPGSSISFRKAETAFAITKKKMLLRDDQKTQRLCSNSGKTKMGIRSPNVYLKDLRWKAYRNIWCSDPWKKKNKTKQ